MIAWMDLIQLAPEALIVLTAIGVLLSEVGYSGEKFRVVTATAVVGLLGALAQVIFFTVGLANADRFPVRIVEDSYLLDGISVLIKICALLLGVFSMVAVHQSREIERDRVGETQGLLCLMVCGVCVVASGSNLGLLLLGSFLVNLPTVFLCSISSRSTHSLEASAKFFGFMTTIGFFTLMGCGLLYAATQELGVSAIHQKILTGEIDTKILISGLVFLFFAVALHLAVFPFYFWKPDVLQGAPTAIAGSLSGLQALAGVALAIRICIGLFSQPELQPGVWMTLPGVDWPRMLAIVSGITIFSGAFLAIGQTSIKRLVGALLVMNSGLILTGIIVQNQSGISSLLYMLIIGVFAAFGAFVMATRIIEGTNSDAIRQNVDFNKISAFERVSLVVFMLTLSGLPPFPGAVARFALIENLLKRGWTTLSIIAILSLALSAIAIGKLGIRIFPIGNQNAGGESLPHPTYRVSRIAFLVVLFLPIALVSLFSGKFLGWAANHLQVILW